MPNEDRVEVKMGPGGFQMPQDPETAAPRASVDKRDKIDRYSMKAKSLQVVSDGTLAGTAIMVDGVMIGGVTRFEMVAQKGYKRITAVVDMAYDKENTPEHGELAGTEVRSDSGAPMTIMVDVFKRA